MLLKIKYLITSEQDKHLRLKFCAHLNVTNRGTIMTEFSEIARNKNRFRAACKDLSVEQLETIANHLSEFIDKRKQEEIALAEQSAKKDAEKQAILVAIAEAGLTPEDFFSADAPKANKVKKTRKPVAAQYRITDTQGIMCEWSGRGRTPKAFEHYFNNGGTKDSCRI
jgi:DNA-binding protein H-NS